MFLHQFILLCLSFINQASDKDPSKLLLSQEKAFFSKETAGLVMKSAQCLASITVLEVLMACMNSHSTAGKKKK